MGRRTVLAPHTCCEHKMEALGLRLAEGGHPGVVGSSPPSHLCHRQGSVAHLAGTPTQPSPSWASSGMMMALPPARHSVGGSDTKTLCGLADAAGPVLTHDTRMPAVQREPALQEELPRAQCMKRERLSGWVTDNLKSCLNFKSIYLGNSNTETLEKYLIDRQTGKRVPRRKELHPVGGLGLSSGCFLINRSGAGESGDCFFSPDRCQVLGRIFSSLFQ